MDKLIKTDFWRVEMGKETRSFETVLSLLEKIPDDESRNFQSGTDPIRLGHLEKKGDYWFGDMVKIRMDYVPPRAKVSGGIKPLNLEDDEGIGEEMAFLYDPQFRLLLTQRNRYGVSSSTFQLYVYSIAELSDFVTLDPVVKLTALKRLQGMREIRKFKVTFARVTNPLALKTQGKALGNVVDVLQDFGACSAHIDLSMGHYSGSLTLRNVKDFIKTAARLNDAKNSVTKLEVDGIDSDGIKTVFDILDYRLVKEEEVRVTRQRQLTYQARIACLRSAHKSSREEIASLFTPENE